MNVIEYRTPKKQSENKLATADVSQPRMVFIGDEQSPFTEEQFRRLARKRTHSKCIAPQFKI